MPSKTPLKLSHVTKRYGHARGIEDVSLNLEPGEVFGFLGPNGAGKTTTIRTIMNFLRPSSGKIEIFGLDSVHGSVATKQRVGFLSGDLPMYDNLTGAQYLAFIANLRGVHDKKTLKTLVDRLDVETTRKIHTLSRGNKQKIGLAAALIHDPDLLILDEPTSGLDPLMQNQFYEIVKEHTKQGKTVFISSHILSEVQTVCDRVGFMRQGKLIETVNVSKLLHDAKNDVWLAMNPHQKVPSLSLFKDVEIVHQTDHEVRFLTSTPTSEIVAWLSKQSIHDVSMQRTSLDDMFLKLYSGDHEEISHA
jgi:ABC-2 type transport system ATP-binding protein